MAKTPLLGCDGHLPTGQLLPAVCNRLRQCCCRVGRHRQGREIQRTEKPVHLPAHCCRVSWPHEPWRFKFHADLGRTISLVSGDKETFLFQRIYVLLSQFNSASGFITQLFWLGRLPIVLTFPFFLTFQCFSYRHFHKGLKNNNNKNNNNNNDYFIFLLFLLFTVNKVSHVLYNTHNCTVPYGCKVKRVIHRCLDKRSK